MGWGGWKSIMPAPVKFLTTGDMGSWFGIPGLDEDANSKIPGVGRFFKSDNQKDLEDQMKTAADQYAQQQTQLPASRIAAGRGAANAFGSSSNFLGEMSGGRYQRPNFDQVFVNPNPAPAAPAKAAGKPAASSPAPRRATGGAFGGNDARTRRNY